jgi:hypothetical protein
MDNIANQPDVLLEQLLFDVTKKKGDVGGAERARHEEYLRAIKEAYKKRWPRLTSAEAAKRTQLLQKYLKNTEERRELRQQLGTDGEQEILEAGYNRIMFGPDLGENELKATMMVANSPRIIGDIEEVEDQNIKFLLASEYHKDLLRTVVIEPFLLFLNEFDLWESARPLPTAMKTLLDWLGVEQKYRFTDAGIRTIVREFKQDDVQPDRRLRAQAERNRAAIKT